MAFERFSLKLPSEGSSVATKVDVTRYNFGRNYTQKVLNGLNSERRTYSVLFKDISQTEHDAIIDFLSRNKGKTFLWQPPDGADGKWSCDEWDTEPRYTHDIKATFVEEFDPA